MKYFSKLLQLVLSLLVLGLFLASCSNDDGDGGNNAGATEITATAYTGSFTIGGTAYKTLKMASDNTYHIKGDNGEDTGTYALSSGSRSIANGTYIFYSKTNNGKTFYVIVSDSGIVLESGTLDASGNGTLRTSSEESSGDDENGTATNTGKMLSPRDLTVTQGTEGQITVKWALRVNSYMKEKRQNGVQFCYWLYHGNSDNPTEAELLQTCTSSSCTLSLFRLSGPAHYFWVRTADGYTEDAEISDFSESCMYYFDMSDFSETASYTLTVAEFADKVSEIREKGLARAIFVITDATNDNVSELRSSINSDSFSVKLDLSQSSELTKLPKDAFYKADSLYEIILPSSLLKIGDTAFVYCEHLQHISIPNSVTSIEFRAFDECENLESLDIPDSVIKMDGYAIQGCSKLTTINIGTGLKEIGHFGDGLENFVEINVAEGNPNFASLDGVLYNKDITKLIAFPCGKSSVTIPDTVTSFAEGAFWDAVALETLNIPDSVTQAGGGLPNQAPKLTSITVGKGLVSFYRLYDCPNLTNITVSGDNKYLKSENNAVYSKDGSILYVVAGGLTEFTIPDTTTEIYERAFRGCEKLENIVIPDSVTTIGGGAFYGCTNLSSVTLGTGLSEFQDWFDTHNYGSTPSKLTSITIPKTITKMVCPIGFYSSVTSVIFEDTESIWYITSSSTYSDGTEIGPMSSDGAENAAKLKANYPKRWYNSKMVE